jgi:hypothetical protein
MAANGISTLANKKLRQEARLNLAVTNRTASGRRSTLNLSQLPTVYKADNTLTNNPNNGGLVAGRPWT